MYHRHFMHLPLADDDNNVIGMVDISMLSFYILLHVSPRNGSYNTGEEEGQDWTFWNR